MPEQRIQKQPDSVTGRLRDLHERAITTSKTPEAIWAGLDPLNRLILTVQRLGLADRVPAAPLAVPNNERDPHFHLPPRVVLSFLLLTLAASACGADKSGKNSSPSPTPYPTIDRPAVAQELWDVVDAKPASEKAEYIVFSEGSGHIPLRVVFDDPEYATSFEGNDAIFTVLSDAAKQLTLDPEAFAEYPELLTWIENGSLPRPVRHEILFSTSDNAIDEVLITQDENGGIIVRSTISLGGIIIGPLTDVSFLPSHFGYGAHNGAEIGIRASLVNKLAYAMVRAQYPYILPPNIEDFSPEIERALAIESVAEGFAIAAAYAYNPYIDSELRDQEDYTEAERMRKNAESVGMSAAEAHLYLGLYPDYPAPHYMLYYSFLYEWWDSVHRDDPEGSPYRHSVRIGNWSAPVSVLGKSFFYDLTERVAAEFPLRTAGN